MLSARGGLRLRHTVNWFEKHLMGKKIIAYDLYPE
jgi:hypothetical protein